MRIQQTARSQGRQRRWQPQLAGAAQGAVLVAVALAVLWPAPVEPDQLFAAWPGSDLVYSHWPFALLIQRTFAQAQRLPWWNPYFGGGLPVGADPLAALFYPPTQLVHLFPLRTYFLVLVAGHLVFAGLGTLLLARRAFRLPTLPALVAAVAYMATPRLLSHLGAGHVTVVQTVAWYPWLALACQATLSDPRRRGALLGVCLACMLLAGHPQMAYYGTLMIGGLVAWQLLPRWRAQGWRSLHAPLAGLLMAGALGLLLTSIHLLPLLELTGRSTRQLSLSSGDALPPGAFLSALVVLPPQAGSPWEGLLSPGPAALALALLAIVARWRRSWPSVLGIGLVAGLAMGNASPLYLLVSRILPDLDLFRGLARIWFLGLLLLSLLAGSGADVLLQAVRRCQWRATPALAGALTLLLVASSLVAIDSGYTRTAAIQPVVTPSALARTAQQLAGNGRIYDEQENLTQTDAATLQLRLADGWDPLLIESYVRYMQRAGNYAHSGYTLHIPYDSPAVQPDAALLGLMNVSVVISRRPLTDPLLLPVGQVDGTLIYRNTADAGPAYLLQADAAGNVPEINRATRSEGAVRTALFTPEQEVFSVSSRAEAYLVIAAPQFPGWTVSLDGHPAPLHLFAGVMPAVRVEPGTHTLRYAYAPTLLLPGAILSGIGLLATLAWLLIGQSSGRRRSTQQAHQQFSQQQKDQIQTQQDEEDKIERGREAGEARQQVTVEDQDAADPAQDAQQQGQQHQAGQ